MKTGIAVPVFLVKWCDAVTTSGICKRTGESQLVYGILVAGGQGTRLGEKKQYRLLAGKPMWARSLEALLLGGFEKVWLVVPLSDVGELHKDINDSRWTDRVTVVAGGVTRFESVKAGLQAVFQSSETAPTWIGVHDAARPFVSPADIRTVLDAARGSGAAILAEPCPDTVKRTIGHRIDATVPRANLWLAQTPQVFRADWMKAAYWTNLSLNEITDDASVMEQVGHAVTVVAATGENRKITTRSDLEYADCLASMRWGGEEPS